MDAFVKENPHCRQALARPARRHFAGSPEGRNELRRPAEMETTLAAEEKDWGSMEFVHRPDRDRSSIHWGQLKLLLSELELLTGLPPEGLTVIYAGAAPGHHIPFLARHFPRHQWRLYDPSPFSAALLGPAAPGNVVACRGFFDDQTAAALAAEFPGGAGLVFISDIRSGKTEGHVEKDMAAQAGWVRAMGPAVSMLKFRLPWGEGSVPYFDGTVHLQAFPPATSTETRLVSTRAQALAPPRVWDCLAYERALAWHNTVVRARGYSHGANVEGLDHCYDCGRLVRAATDFLRAGAGIGAGENLEAVEGFIRGAIAASAGASRRSLSRPGPVSSNRR